MEKIRQDGAELYKGRGYPLRAAMLQKMFNERKRLKHLGDELGISYGYILHLGKEKPFSGLNIELMRNVAQYLGISTVKALILGEHLVAEDLKVRKPLKRDVDS